jgi:hypothetical protein
MSENRHSGRLGYAGAKFHQSSPSGHDDLNRARQAAEALFTPKRPIVDSARPEATGTAEQDQHKPRILSAVGVIQRVIQPAHASTMQRLKHETRRPRKRVPASHLERIQTWVEYG